MSHPTFRKLFYCLALIALAAGMLWPTGEVSAACAANQIFVPGVGCVLRSVACVGEPSDPPECNSGGGSTTTTSATTTSTTPPVVETGVRNSSPGSLQGFIQNDTGIQQLYTNSGQFVANIPLQTLQALGSLPLGAEMTVVVPNGGGLLHLTNQGNGSFIGQDDNGNDFNFNRPDLTGLPTASNILNDPNAPFPSYFLQDDPNAPPEAPKQEIRVFNADGVPIYLPPGAISLEHGPSGWDLHEAIAQAILGPGATQQEIEDTANNDIVVYDMAAARQMAELEHVIFSSREEAWAYVMKHESDRQELLWMQEQIKLSLQGEIDSTKHFMDVIWGELRRGETVKEIGAENMIRFRKIQAEIATLQGINSSADSIYDQFTAYKWSKKDAFQAMQTLVKKCQKVITPLGFGP